MGDARGAHRDQRPSADVQGRIAVVHNGIIENHEGLRARLEAQGYEFESATDTEVIAHLIDSYVSAGSTLTEAVRKRPVR